MLKKIKYIQMWFSYKLSEMKNFYSHKAVGWRQDSEGKTIILYTILGKRDVHEISIETLMADKDLLEHFHPCQTTKFGVIAIGDVLFSMPLEQREKKYRKIKNKMLEPNDAGHRDSRKKNTGGSI